MRRTGLAVCANPRQSEDNDGMAEPLPVFVCAVLMALYWTLIGLPVCTRIFPAREGALFAPIVGWAIQSALALPLFMAVGMSRLAVVAVLLSSAVVAAIAIRPAQLRTVPAWWLALALVAALLAAIPALAVLPKWTADGVALAAPIYDHSKIAMVDEMARAGVPPVNPFFALDGGQGRLIYYYLWHFSAAQFAVATGASGWVTDAALSGFTAFASLLLSLIHI